MLALRAFLNEAGVEAAKTTPHWQTLAAAFGMEKLEPYLKDAPMPALGKLFASDLGM